MKKTSNKTQFTLVLLTLVLLTSISPAQQQKLSGNSLQKIGFITTYLYLDRKEGINKLAKYDNYISTNCSHSISNYGGNDLSKNIAQIRQDLTDKNLKAETRRKKEKKLVEIYEIFKNKWDKCYKRQHEILIKPIEKKVDIAINEIATFNRIKVFEINSYTLDKFIYFNKELDISNKVIPIINNYLNNKNLPYKKIHLSPSKIISIQTKLVKVKKNTNFFRFIPDFAKLNKCDVIFDSSSDLPKEIQQIISRDATQDFIKYVNKYTQ